MARPKHRTRPGATYFLTTNAWERRALFHKPEAAKIVERKIFEYRGQGFILVHAYVIMPDHLHVIHANKFTDRYFPFWNFFSAFVVHKDRCSEVEAILIAAVPTANSSQPRFNDVALSDEVRRILKERRKIDADNPRG